jgi:hypothetical protein
MPSSKSAAMNHDHLPRRVSTFARFRPLSDGIEFDMRRAVEVASERLAHSGEHGFIAVEVIDAEAPDEWGIELAGDTATATHHRTHGAVLTLRADLSTWREVAGGDLSPYVAIALRRMAIAGNLGMALRLLARLTDE